jgi:pyruvate kinase
MRNGALSSSVHGEQGGAALGQRLSDLYRVIIERAREIQHVYPFADRDCACSRDNLLAYLILREHDLHDLQWELAEEGLSSLGRLEGSVLTSLEKVMRHVNATVPETDLATPTLTQARALLAHRSRSLLGRPREGRATRIMVTLDTDAAHQPALLEQLLACGMDIARINCAHDTAREWESIIQAIRSAEERLTRRGVGVGRRCRILMDLAGPKVRTGPIQLETRPLKLSVPKVMRGRPIRALEGYLDSEATLTYRVVAPGEPVRFIVAVPRQSGVGNLLLGQELRFTDTRDRRRSFRVLERISPTRVRIGLERTAYLQEGTILSAAGGAQFTVGSVAPQPADVRVKAGDTLLLYRDPARVGHPAQCERPAGISCTLPDALTRVDDGHHIFIDDGRIAGIVRAVLDDRVEVEVTAPQTAAVRIKPEKGLNFPDTVMPFSALTDEDREHLRFVVKHANAVGLSFIHSPQDLEDLRAALVDLGHPDMGIIIKVETREAIHRLAQLLLAGLGLPKFGVMIARGDLAVEVGFENLALVQEDILCLCEAAHVPVIWATQVLETLAKRGMPARAEITDAAMGQRAECVMLNKGEHVIEAVKTLAELLTSEEQHRIKKRQVFRNITAQRDVFPPVRTRASDEPATAP